MAKFSNGVRLLAAAVCFWSCCVQQPVFGAEAVVSARAIADYHQNVFDPNNITGSPEAVQEARAPVNVETTAATWHSGNPHFRQDIPSLPCNIVFIKLLKVGGSTAGGICRRIAAHREENNVFDKNFPSAHTEPGVWADHSRYSSLESRIAGLKKPSLVIGWIRNPVARCMSSYYFFQISRAQGKSSSPKAILNYMQDNCAEHEYTTLATAHLELQDEAFTALPLLDQVTSLYHFIGVMERFDESLIVMKNTFKLTYSDILYLPSKVSNPSSPSGHKPWSSESLEVQEYGLGQEFYMKNRLDFMLHAHVNQVLDREIAAIPDFEEQLSFFKDLNQKGFSECAEASHKARASANVRAGQDEPGCYHSDNGCGFACLDRFAERELGVNHSHVSQKPANLKSMLQKRAESRGSDRARHSPVEEQQRLSRTTKSDRRPRSMEEEHERDSDSDGPSHKHIESERGNISGYGKPHRHGNIMHTHVGLPRHQHGNLTKHPHRPDAKMKMGMHKYSQWLKSSDPPVDPSTIDVDAVSAKFGLKPEFLQRQIDAMAGHKGPAVRKGPQGKLLAKPAATRHHHGRNSTGKAGQNKNLNMVLHKIIASGKPVDPSRLDSLAAKLGVDAEELQNRLDKLRARMGSGRANLAL